ncbi:MarR family winged helix-turn-helix transcriptional regulator [Streptomyces sp. NPDC048845]|uniref:MarR family winged helix-turn-helix transcriptional regulator n=1 Tax=Streptomyces sp. NPDC048845 TaxID=3155390 RepID=UPI0034452AF1
MTTPTGPEATAPGSAGIQATSAWRLALVLKEHRGLMSAELASLGLYAGQDVFLSQLWAEDGLTQSQLTERLHVEPPTVSKMLGRMERSGLLERRRDDRDGRISRVYLTERGRAAQEAVENFWQELDAVMGLGSTPEELALLHRMLDRMHANLRSATVPAGGPGGGPAGGPGAGAEDAGAPSGAAVAEQATGDAEAAEAAGDADGAVTRSS